MKIEVCKALKQLNLEGQGWRVQSFMDVLGYNVKFFFQSYLNEVQYKQIEEYFHDNPKRSIIIPEIAKLSPLYIPEEGDVITIPEIFLIKKAENSNDSYIYALVRNKNGEERSVSFFPSVLKKTFSSTDIPQYEVLRDGTATQLFRTSENINSGLKLLSGKKILVKGIGKRNIVDNDANTIKTIRSYQFDLISETKSSTKKDRNEFTLLTNRCYLRQWESFPINDTQKRIALDLSQNIEYIWADYCSGEETNIADNNVIHEYEIKHYGVDVDPVTIVRKGIYSFIIMICHVKEYFDYKDCTCIIPLRNKIEDVYFDYDEYKYQNICYKEFIIEKENGQHGVFDFDGRNVFPFIDNSISFVKDAIITTKEGNRNLYLVKDRLQYYTLYCKDQLLFKYIYDAVPYFMDDNRYLVVDHQDGCQVYDFRPWLNKESAKPVPLFRKKLKINGCLPVPSVYSENKMGVSNNEDRYGFIDVPSGRLVIPCIYKEILQGYEQGKAKVSIDDHGNYVIIDYKNTILGWGNSYKERLEAEERYFNSNVGDWSFADADLEDFRDNYDY